MLKEGGTKEMNVVGRRDKGNECGGKEDKGNEC